MMRRLISPILAPILACHSGSALVVSDREMATNEVSEPGRFDDTPLEEVKPTEDIIVWDADTDDIAELDPDPCPEGRVYVDFPCMKRVECISHTAYREFQTLDCLDLGYDPRCCSGATCVEVGTNECPEGTLCIHWEWDQNDACMPADCGGPDGQVCPDGQSCERPEDGCDPSLPGVCLDVSTCLDRCDGSLWCRWVCGCDGRSYPSDCDRRFAGVSRAHEGPCCVPQKVDVDQANAQGFTHFAACVDSAVKSPQLVFQGAQCAKVGASPLCGDDERACMGSLTLDPGGTSISDESWQMACRAAGYPFVSRVVGYSCAGVAPGPVPLCGVACDSPCGCEKCPPLGDAKCDGKKLFKCCPGDTCWHVFPCDGNCVPESPSGATCSRSCQQIAADWYQTIAWNTECGPNGAGCHVLKGHCEVGLGDCWVVAADWLPQKELDWIASEWISAGCSTSSTCDCHGPPIATCVDGNCVLQ